ncbi:tRNA isopentenyltransferase [Gloeopeniophorella convolvens]|nr:tRNA isopentenyltransferase [Gloeopeniophorella convolvens]
MALHPVIAICGTTGVGKSKLSVELALRISKMHEWNGGVVINADAMQAYKGFNTITNKISFEERAGVEHVLMDFKEPTEQYVVGQWIHDATKAIGKAHESKKVPIVVGGTAYWVQHLIFPGRLAVEPGRSSTTSISPSLERTTFSDELSSALLQASSDMRDLFKALPEVPPSAADDPGAALALHNLLRALDPIVADRWHWRDTRKVLRSLEIMRNSGRRTSEVFRDQSSVAVAPKYDTLFLWLHAESTELQRRLDTRAEEMLQNGLLDEVRELRGFAWTTNESGGDGSSSSPIDLTFGIFQSIGFREFNQYLSDPSPPDKKYATAMEEMKIANRQYAKRQISWIRNKLLPVIRASKSTEGARSAEMFLLDATARTAEPQKWTSDVRDVAGSLTEAFLGRNALPDPPTLSPAAGRMLSIPEKATDPTAVLLARRKVVCPVCTVDEAQPVMIEEGSEWATHIKTKIHKRLAAKAKGPMHRAPREACKAGKGPGGDSAEGLDEPLGSLFVT